jgi:hypothetical protein
LADEKLYFKGKELEEYIEFLRDLLFYSKNKNLVDEEQFDLMNQFLDHIMIKEETVNQVIETQVKDIIDKALDSRESELERRVAQGKVDGSKFLKNLKTELKDYIKGELEEARVLLFNEMKVMVQQIYEDGE